MTRNQIDYWKNVETERHNRAVEAQGLVDLDLKRQANTISAGSLAETQRSNQAREAETNRSNLAKEANELLRTNETIRHNQATESETHRSNVVQENLSNRSLKETQRHNEVTEFISANKDPWTTLTTTLSSIFNPDSPSPQPSFSLPSPAKVVQDVKGYVQTQGVKYGLIKPNSSATINPSVKQLPNLSSYAFPKSVGGNNPASSQKSVNKSAKSTPAKKAKPNVATSNLFKNLGVGTTKKGKGGKF